MKPVSIVLIVSGLCIAVYSMLGDSPRSLHADRTSGSAPSRSRTATRFTAERPVPAPLRTTAEIAETSQATGKIVEHREPPSPTIALSSDEVQDRLEAFFNSETVDPTWNSTEVDTLSRSIQAALPTGSRLQRIDCRGTLCRIETRHLDVEEYRAYVHDGLLNPESSVGRSGAFASLIDEPAPGKPVVAVAYVARDGKALPGPEALFATR